MSCLYVAVSTVSIQRQKGVGVIEFAVSAGMLVIFIIAIPLVGKIANLNILAIQSLDYAAWEVQKREGTATSAILTRDVNDRFFAASGAYVKTGSVPLGANLGFSGAQGKAMVIRGSVKVQVTPITNRSNDLFNFDEVGRLTRDLKLSSNSYYKVKVTVPLTNLKMLDGLSDSLVITKEMNVLTNSWISKSNIDTNDHIKNAGIRVYPHQRASVLINKLKPVFDLFGEPTIRTDVVDSSVVPR